MITPQVQAANTPQGYADTPQHKDTAYAQGVEVGKSLDRAANAAMLIQDAMDKDRVKEAMNSAIRQGNALQLLATSKLGKDALDVKDDNGESVGLQQHYGNQLEKVINQHRDELGNDRQRGMFVQQMRQYATQFDADVGRHVLHQSKVYADQTDEAAVAVAQDQAAAFYNDPAKVEQSRNVIQQSIVSVAERNGMGEEWVASKSIDALGKMHESVIKGRVQSGSIADAKSYLETIRTEIPASRLDDVDKLVKIGDIKGESLRLSLSLTGTVEQRQEKLKRLFESGEISAEKYDATRQRVEHEWQVYKAIESERSNQILGAAFQWSLNNPGKNYLDLPVQLQRELEKSGHNAQVANFMRQGGKPETDPVVYTNLRLMAAENPAQYRSLGANGLLAYRDKLDDGDYNKLVEVMAQIDKNDAKTMTLNKALADALRMSDRAIAAGGIDLRAKPGSSKAERADRFKSELIRRLESEIEQNGKVDNKRALEITNALLMKGENDGFFWNPNALKFEGNETWKPQHIKFSNIPPADRAEFARRGITDPAQVESIYNRYKQAESKR